MGWLAILKLYIGPKTNRNFFSTLFVSAIFLQLGQKYTVQKQPKYFNTAWIAKNVILRDFREFKIT